MAKYANIIVDISHEKLDKTFQYLIPEELMGEVRVGMLVEITLRPQVLLRNGLQVMIGMFLDTNKHALFFKNLVN